MLIVKNKRLRRPFMC